MRLRALVEQGALCSITAGAFSGRFGQGPRWFALELMRDGLVHSVDSDAHNLLGRPPGLREGLLDAAETLPVRRPARGLVHEARAGGAARRRAATRATLRRVVDRGGLRDHLLDGEVLGVALLVTPRSSLRGGGSSRSSSMIACGERLRVARRDEQAGLGHDRLARAADVADHLRDAARQRLQRADRERLPARAAARRRRGP